MFPLEIFEKLCQLIAYVHAIHEEFWKILFMFGEKMKREIEPNFPSVPQDVSIQPIILDYNNRKHLFAYNPTNAPITLTSDGGGDWSTSVPAFGWANVSFPSGTRLKASAANTIIKLKATDEAIP